LKALNEEEFRNSIREWIRRNAPMELMNRRILIDTTEIDDYSLLINWQRKLYEAGYLGITWPKKYGGYEMDPIYELIAYEEFTNSGLPYGRSLGSIGILVAGPAILNHGSEEQKAKYLPRILKAEDIWCQGFSEPSAGSDLASLKTRAEKRGNTYVIKGQKIWSSYAHLANYMILLARTGEERYKGLTMFIVNMKQEGIKVSPITQITLKGEFNSIFIENAVVPEENVIGREGDGWKVAMTVLNHERFLNGVSQMFVSEKTLNMLKDRGKAKGVKIDVEDIEIEVIALKAFYERILDKLRRGEELGEESAVLKLRASELLQEVYNAAVKNFDYEELVKEKWFLGMLSSRGRTIAAGTSEILRNLIGERILKLPK